MRYLSVERKVEQKRDASRENTTNYLFYLHLVDKNGAARRIRTADPIITNDVLYQLS
ncbi:hypothetical protein KL86PLE_60375 [uncultured Pleomorphomonas sp.]|uniref:Uncharacterized protein n=1 Tax=uncultured Pleomorphomonas sp. TaxID=442121 RepID=A0A212LKJ8_9HYPH|nr:hypothetical protein KL86PLE_60375 [uncultured Pleomorphomonas sp.]